MDELCDVTVVCFWLRALGMSADPKADPFGSSFLTLGSG